MRVLVVGAFGYLGTALVQRLLREHDVCAVGRKAHPLSWNAMLEVVRRTGRSLTIAERDALSLEWPWSPEGDRGCEDEAVVHLAGIGASGGAVDPFAALRDNAFSALHVAKIVPSTVRKIFASSIYVYGRSQYSDLSRAMVEDDPPAPDTLYGAQKLVAEAAWCERGGTALRFAHIYGVGSGVNFGRDGVTERLAKAVARGTQFKVHVDASTVDLVHIDDACEAIASALCAPKLPPLVNIGGGDPIAVSRLANVFYGCEKFAEERGFAKAVSKWFGRNMNISLAARTLGWKPTVALADGAKQLVDTMTRSS